jgi:endonuclease G
MKSDGDFRDLVARTRPERLRVRQLITQGKWRSAEPDKARLSSYVARTAEFASPRGAEALQGDTVDFQPVSFLPIGTRVQRAVGYVEVMAAGMSSSGTGFLISPELLITNQHVIPDASAARGAQIVFDRQVDGAGRPMPTTTFLLDPDRCAIFSPEGVLDYAIVAIGARTSGTAALADLGYCPLSNRPDKHVIGMNVNIVQHPDGAPKLIAIRNNLLTYRTDTTLLYETDTDHGSSGSPVYNDLWEVVALHHFGEPFLHDRDENGQPIPQTVNEGVRISAIYTDLEARSATLDAGAAALVATALSYDRHAPASDGDRTLGPPCPSQAATAPAHQAGEASRLPTIPSDTGGTAMTTRSQGQELKLVLPLEISIRIGTPEVGAPLAETAPADPALKAPEARDLVKGAEKISVDVDYSNRSGYDPEFIPGITVALPEPGPELAKQIGTLRAGEGNPDRGVLAYEHFSLVMNRSKRVAMFTATNIDGETYLNVDRRSGQVKNAAEGETWFNDPRISASFYIGQAFYSNWSQYFDHGHLTRRSDPTWGTPAEAARANADTYHFTNCSPQHFRFNESSQYWQGAEIYVLEQGLLAADSKQRLCVFQGPIYADDVDRWADDVQIPSSFFKVIVWKGREGVKAVGLVVDQLPLLDQKRSFVQVGTKKQVQVAQWRVAIADIAKRTGLVFPETVLDADTIGATAAPVVGEASRAGIPIRSMADITL